MDKLDLSTLLGNVKISIESDEHDADRELRIWKDKTWTKVQIGAVVLCGLALMILGGLAIAVGFGALGQNVAEEARKYAATVGTAIISGAIGWVGGSLKR